MRFHKHIVSARGQRRFQGDGFQGFTRLQALGAIEHFAGLRERDFDFTIVFALREVREVQRAGGAILERDHVIRVEARYAARFARRALHEIRLILRGDLGQFFLRAR